MTTPNYAEMVGQLRYRMCLHHPKKLLVVGMKDGAYVPQCNDCLREGVAPVFGEAPGRVLERSGQMIQSLATREQRLATLSVADIKTLLPVGKATESELKQFILYCKAVNADPWAKEAYLVKYTEKDPAAIVLSLNWYLKRASHNPLYESYESGVIVERQGQYVTVVGSIVYPGDTLLGAWCKVYKKGARTPFERRVSMTEYDKHQFGWVKMPATMIEKVAIVQGIRRAFPDEFAGEGEAVTELPIVMEGEVEEVPPVLTPPVSTAATQATPDDPHCPKHPGALWTLIQHWVNGQKVTTWSHIIAGETGPKGGRIFCEMSDIRADTSLDHTRQILDNALANAQEPPPLDPEAPSEAAAVPQTPRKATFENLGALFSAAGPGWQVSGLSQMLTRDQVATAAGWKDSDALVKAVGDGSETLEQVWGQVLGLYGSRT